MVSPLGRAVGRTAIRACWFSAITSCLAWNCPPTPRICGHGAAAAILLRAVEVNDYERHMRVRSPKWGTVALPTAAYRELVRPFHLYSQKKLTVPQGTDVYEPGDSWDNPSEYEESPWQS